MNIRVAIPSDLKQIAEVHVKCFKGTFIAYWGVDLIQRYYEEYYNEAPLFVVAEENSKVVGFCMGYRTGSNARSSFLQHNKIRLAFRMTILCLSLNKLAIKKCWNALNPQKASQNDTIKTAVDADLLSICVSDECKGKGVAKTLVESFEDVLRSNKLSDYTLSVYKSNTRAISFYKKMGMSIVSESTDEYKMYKRL